MVDDAGAAQARVLLLELNRHSDDISRHSKPQMIAIGALTCEESPVGTRAQAFCASTQQRTATHY
ncbi:hypothetical protein [Mycolicibacterium sp. 050158]|uniref:hypothetical protein n=1 Tax=Mycolicibacterium sp. 050158 TaxID=3090602 RepID=UPI00299DB00E|nr:hypothetical protein [Mycolicibacterium sp. 050158]MDX1893299.1 hypothetical protein [Mycolicibacterium sp. 050158]